MLSADACRSLSGLMCTPHCNETFKIKIVVGSCKLSESVMDWLIQVKNQFSEFLVILFHLLIFLCDNVFTFVVQVESV